MILFKVKYGKNIDFSKIIHKNWDFFKELVKLFSFLIQSKFFMNFCLKTTKYDKKTRVCEEQKKSLIFKIIFICDFENLKVFKILRKSLRKIFHIHTNFLLFLVIWWNHFFELVASGLGNQLIVFSIRSLCLKIPIQWWKPHLDW
jgi:hypothetical protein